MTEKKDNFTQLIMIIDEEGNLTTEMTSLGLCDYLDKEAGLVGGDQAVKHLYATRNDDPRADWIEFFEHAGWTWWRGPNGLRGYSILPPTQRQWKDGWLNHRNVLAHMTD